MVAFGFHARVAKKRNSLMGESIKTVLLWNLFNRIYRRA